MRRSEARSIASLLSLKAVKDLENSLQPDETDVKVIEEISMIKRWLFHRHTENCSWTTVPTTSSEEWE